VGRLRFLTAGESHGQTLGVTLEGVPAGLALSEDELAVDMARRQRGYGRGARQAIEQDRAEIVAGVRHGLTLGSPILLLVRNRDWDNWTRVMQVEALSDDEAAELVAAADGGNKRATPVTRVRPGHADLAGALKYGFDDVRNVLERASARETAARVAAGAFCKAFLEDLGIGVFSHVVQVGTIRSRRRTPPEPDEQEAVDASPVRCADPEASKAMTAEIDRLRKAKDSVGGVFEVLAYGVPPGLGSYVQSDRKLDARLAAALMSIQSVKGVEVGDGFATAGRPGSKAHDEIVVRGGRLARASARAGGIEGGMSTGQPIRVRAAMKPFSTVPRPLRTVDLDTGAPAVAIKQRTDVCAVPAGGVVGEAVVAFVLADAVLEKFGGDSAPETRGNLDRYLEGLP
jgi:chorismate synthase